MSDLSQPYEGQLAESGMLPMAYHLIVARILEGRGKPLKTVLITEAERG